MMGVGDRHRQRVRRVGAGDLRGGEQALDHRMDLHLLRRAGTDQGLLHQPRRIFADVEPAPCRREQDDAARLAELQGRLGIFVEEDLLDRGRSRAMRFDDAAELLVEALTDNRNRTATNVRTIFSKNGGTLGASGSVTHGFLRLGLIAYPASAGSADTVLEAALGEPEGVKLAWRPQTSVEVGEEDAAQLLKLVDTLEEDDDVQTVWGNYEVSDAVLEKLG